jgi:hypothetical protein
MKRYHQLSITFNIFSFMVCMQIIKGKKEGNETANKIQLQQLSLSDTILKK